MVIIGSLENIVRYLASQPVHPRGVAVRRIDADFLRNRKSEIYSPKLHEPHSFAS
jgi:hypothetical protein